MSKDRQPVVQIASVTLLLALWLQLPFLLYTNAPASWSPLLARGFNILTASLGLCALLLFLSDVRFVIRLGIACSALFLAIDAMALTALPTPAGQAAWLLMWPLAAHGAALVIFWLFYAGPPLKLSQGFSLMVLATVGTFVFVEWACRTVSSPAWSEASDWRWYALKVKRNEWKMRGEPLTEKPFKRAVHLLLLGDSFTLGYKVDQDKIYATRVAQAWGDSPPLQVLNGSQVNWSIDSERKFYDAIKTRWHSDIVVVAHVLNDVVSDRPSPPMPVWKLWAIYDLYAYRIIRPWIELGAQRPFIEQTLNAYAPAGRPWADYFHELHQLQSDVQSRGGRMGVLIFPWITGFDRYPFSKIHADLHQQLDRMRIPYLDLLEIYSKYPARELAVSSTDAHPGPFAQNLAAQALVPFLRQRLLK